MVQTYEYSNRVVKLVDEGEKTSRELLEKLMLWVGEREMREFLIAQKLMRRRTSRKGLRVAKGKMKSPAARRVAKGKMKSPAARLTKRA